jgi:hypothetical protein
MPAPRYRPAKAISACSSANAILGTGMPHAGLKALPIGAPVKKLADCTGQLPLDASKV